MLPKKDVHGNEIVGELSRSFDPAVSEWGNPITFIRDYSVAKMLRKKHITTREGTTRTETSK